MRLSFLRESALAAFVSMTPAVAHDPSASAGAQTLAQAHDPAECYCRAQGRMFSVGETVCLRTGQGPRLAQCGMVLNNTSWRITAKACPES